MWIKFILCGAIIAFSMFISYLLAAKFRERKRFFQSFLQFHERFLNELTYLRRPLQTFLREFKGEDEFQKFIVAGAEELPTHLSEDEKTFCCEYQSMLGRGSASSQMTYFKGQDVRIRKAMQESSEECRQKCGLYIKLGLLAGLAIVILIV